MLLRHFFVGVHQMCRITPMPWISARVMVSPGCTTKYGFTFQPVPKSRAARRALPSSSGVAPPLPGSPVMFSGLIERDMRLSGLVRSQSMKSLLCTAQPLRCVLLKPL